MAYRYAHRSHAAPLPTQVEDLVALDHPVRAYDAFVRALDFAELGIVLNSKKVGNASYDPVMMLSLLVFSYSYGWRSSRKIERACHDNIAFIWLCGGLKPDFKTISEFRRKNISAFKKALKQCVRMCISFDLIAGNSLFVDGSKWRGAAGNGQSKSRKGWSEYLTVVNKRIEDILTETEKADQSEAGNFVQMSKELSTQEGLKDRIEALLEETKEASDKTKINLTDPDASILHGRQGSHAGYNAQIVTDGKHALIVGADTVIDKNDLHQFIPQITGAEENMGKSCKNAAGDAGYSSVDHLKPFVDDDEHRVIVPTSEHVSGKKKDDPYDKMYFEYDEKEDAYICPAGQVLHNSKTLNRNMLVYRFSSPKICKSCDFWGKCTKAKRGRSIKRLVNEETKQVLAADYESEEGQALYAQRKEKVEHPFGHMKRNMNAGYFLLRGLEAAKGEFNLLCLCFNLRRMQTLLHGIAEMTNIFAKMSVA